MNSLDKYRVLNGNMLKLTGMITMTVDHAGLILFPGAAIFRIIGRLAFPIFAYMISEGAYYTKNRKKYFFMVLGVGVFCQIVMYIASRSLYQCTLITFALSLLIIFCLQRIKKNHIWIAVTVLVLAATVFFCNGLPAILKGTDFEVDYGLWGVMLPVLLYIPNLFLKPDDARCHLVKLPILAAGLCMVAAATTSMIWQWWSLFSVILIALYNGKRGRLNLKYLFYIYYPAHLGILYLIQFIR